MARAAKRQRRQATNAAGRNRPRLRLEHDVGKSKAQKNMTKLWRNGSLCDIEVKVESQTFSAHRFILAAGSDYMSALFCEDRFKDSTDDTIELAEMTAGAFEQILEWLYEGKCDVEESEVVDLLQAASRLQCVDLVPKLEEIIAERLDAATCLGMWDAADRMQLSKLAEAAEAKALQCYEDLVATTQYESLPAAKLARLLSSDDLKVEKEEAAFESVVSWIKSQSTTPTADELSEIFHNIRFPLMSESFISDNVMTDRLVIDNPNAMMSLLKAMRDKAYNKKTRRTSLRSNGRTLHWEDIRPGLRVRIKNDLEVVEALCEREAPGASDPVGWDDCLEEHIGTEHTIAIAEYSCCICNATRSVYLAGFAWPFDALERV